MKKILRNHFFILLSAPIIGLLLLILVHLIPTQVMREHIYYSMDILEDEFEDELIIDGYRASLTGSFTDCLMLEHAIYNHPEHSIMEQVIEMYRPESYDVPTDPNGWQPGNSLRDYCNYVPAPREVSYGRYWHGYLVFLKPLVFLTGIGSIRLFFAALQLLMVGGIIILMTRQGMDGTAVAFLLSMPFLYFVSTFSSLSLSVCMFIMLGASFLMLTGQSFLEKKKLWGEYFLLIGIVTAYMDLLTYPLVTLGFPLVIYLSGIIDEQEKKSLSENVKCTLLYSLEWGFGYGVMWASKWILAALLGFPEIIGDAFANVFVRSGSAENMGRITGLVHVLKRNADPYLNWGFSLLILVGITCMVIMFIRNGKRKPGGKLVIRMLPFWLVAIYPILWFLVLENHSEQHWIFTCRIWAISVFAIGSCISRRKQTP